MDLATKQSEQEQIAEIIATQNDQFRQTWGADFTISGRIVMTRGVAELPPSAQVQIMQAVQTFSDFTEDNNPHGERDFGVFTIESEGKTLKLYWKFDLYNRDYDAGSEIPHDLQVTRRVLTILFPSEY